MKKIVLVALLSAFVAAPVSAASKKSASTGDTQYAIGAGYGLSNNGVLSVRGDYDISAQANAPVKVRVGWDHYKIDFNFGYSYSWSYDVYYAGAYYDFNQQLKLGEKIHPFAGLGFGTGQVTFSCSGGTTVCGSLSSPSIGGLYYIGGVQYNVTPNIDAELSYSGWTGISLGGNFKF
ncbi:MAG: outer membrane beta-barrel protein [Pseudomonadota bacterium]